MHTSLVPALFNAYVLTTFGKYHWNVLGARSFVAIAALSAIGGSLLTANAVMGDERYYASGANGITAGLLAFHAFKTPNLFGAFRWARFIPMGWVGLALAYGINQNDVGIVGGVSGGFLAFLLALW